MPARCKVITLCGSVRFRETFQQVQQRLTLEGSLVLCPVFFDDIQPDAEAKALLDQLHRQRIDMADEVLIINVDGYIGQSTRAEIDYAIRMGKPVHYLT